MKHTINGHDIAVMTPGSGDDPLLLIHGLGGSGNFWTPVMLRFADRFRMIVPDLPGSAASEVDPEASIESMAEDMRALLDALGIGAAHVAAHSMGTMVAQHLAAAAPDRVRDLVLLGPFAEAPDPARKALLERAELAEREGMEPIAEATAQGGTAEQTRVDRPAAVAYVREAVMRQPPAGYAQTCRALSVGQRVPADRVRARTLIVSGSDDKTAPPANVEALTAELPDAQLVMLSGCGHWTLVEQPHEVCAAMLEFYGT